LALHESHSVAPFDDVQAPGDKAVHEVQYCAPVELENSPAGHGVQRDCPAIE
jgi:hypothetical protein